MPLECLDTPVPAGAGPLAARQRDAEALFDEAVAGPADRVLILGPPSTEMLCAALRHGCRAAEETATPPCRPAPAEVVVASRVTTEAEAAAIAACAHRALGASGAVGRIAALLCGTEAPAIAREMTRRLRAQGFDHIRLRPRGEGALMLVCRLQPTGLALGGRA